VRTRSRLPVVAAPSVDVVKPEAIMHVTGIDISFSSSMTTEGPTPSTRFAPVLFRILRILRTLSLKLSLTTPIDPYRLRAWIF